MDAETRQEITRIDHEISQLKERLKDTVGDQKECKKLCQAELEKLKAQQINQNERIARFDEIVNQLNTNVADLKDTTNDLRDGMVAMESRLVTAISEIKIENASNQGVNNTMKGLGYEVLKYFIMMVLAMAFIKSQGGI
jgi:predicted  nucleic acid-binding Zn-ribbon protein